MPIRIDAGEIGSQFVKVASGPCARSGAALGAAVLALTLCWGGAGAAPVYTGTYADMYLKQTTFPSGLSEQQVYLDPATASTVVGHAGGQTGTDVNFYSTTNILDAKSGYSTIKDASGGVIHNLTITAPGHWFHDLIFSVNLSSSADLTVTATAKGGGTDSYSGWTNDSNWVSGDNRVLTLSTGSNLLQSITLDSSSGFTSVAGGTYQTSGGITQYKQTEISGLTPVPLPAPLWLFGSGLVALSGVGRRRKR